MNRVVDIEVSCLRYRSIIVQYRMLISYTISKVFIYWVRYRIRYSIHPMSFTADRKHPLPWLHHACAEESQRHVPWIPAPSFCAIPHLPTLREVLLSRIQTVILNNIRGHNWRDDIQRIHSEPSWFQKMNVNILLYTPSTESADSLQDRYK
jgi:hypothetical protein